MRTKWTRVLAVVLCAVFAVGLMGGCSSDSSQTSGEIKITDQAGREVTLAKPAEKVVGTHNPSMNMVIVLDGTGDRIAGFGNKDMAYGLYDKVWPGINEVTSIGKGKNINFETVASLTPDLAIIPARM